MVVEVDLHLHTTSSDGRLSPTELVKLCAARGLKVISVTDHDSTDGISEALEAAAVFPQLTVVPGIELSTDVPDSEIHMLGYFVDHESEEFQRTLQTFRAGRQDRARKMVEKLDSLGLPISWERVKEIAGAASHGRPHVAQAMVEAGHVKDNKTAFDLYIGRNGPAYVERLKLEPVDAVKTLIENGALPVIAHPTYSASKSDRDEVNGLRTILLELKEAGMAGMEVYYSDYTPDQIDRLAGLADELGLIPCGGSDYHAFGTPDEQQPGSVGPPMTSVEALFELKEKRARTR